MGRSNYQRADKWYMVSLLVTSLLLSKSQILPELMFYHLDYCCMSSLLIVLFHAILPGTAYWIPSFISAQSNVTTSNVLEQTSGLKDPSSPFRLRLNSFQP